MVSKLLPAHQVHTDFNGDIRCSLIEASMGNLFSMTLIPRKILLQVNTQCSVFILQEKISR